MELPKARFWHLVVACAVGAFFGYFVNGFRSHPPIASSDLAAWVQAIGSIGAILGVVYTVKQQESYRRKQALTVASVIASTVAMRITTLGAEIQDVVGKMDQVANVDPDPEIFKKCLESLQAVFRWEPNELALMAPLPNNTAHNIAGGIDALDSAIYLFEIGIANRKLVASERYRKEIAADLSLLLVKSRDRFSSAAEGISQVTIKYKGE